MAQQSFAYGGQAVIEGVMIRGRQFYSVAARHPSGQIRTISTPVPTWAINRWRRVPLVRGILVLAETLVIGFRALTFSAQVAAGEEANDEPIPAWTMALTLAVSLGLGVGLFFILPLFITHSVIDRLVNSSILSNLAEGGMRLLVFFAYLWAISVMPSIKRVFGYHAAEHMSVHAHEHRLPLDPSNVRQFPAAHPRCGTAFLLTVLIVSIIVFALLGTPALPLRILSRIVLIPVVAGISYEVIRFNGAHADNFFVRMLALPSLALQALTTRPPDEGQIEVAISAMNAAIQSDETGTAICSPAIAEAPDVPATAQGPQ